MKERLARAGLVLLVIMVVIGVSHGSSRALTYTFAGDCDTPCGGVSGSLSFADGSLVPGSPYPAPTSFSFSFFGIEITDATALSFGLFEFPEPPFPGVPIAATVPADISFFGADVHTGETPQLSGDPGDALIIFLDGDWIAAVDATCTDAQCTFARARGEFLHGTGAWSTATTDATVPEPSTLFLLTAGLTGLLWVLRRRGRSTRAA
jgi:hypothetical protein